MAWLSAIRSGDESAMALLYDRYSSVVYAVALRVLADTAAAEDVLQEVFMQLWRRPGTSDANRGGLGPWLAVITRNRAIDMLRKRRPVSDIDDVVVRSSRIWQERRSGRGPWTRFRGTQLHALAATLRAGDGLFRRDDAYGNCGQDGGAAENH